MLQQQRDFSPCSCSRQSAWSGRAYTGRVLWRAGERRRGPIGRPVLAAGHRQFKEEEDYPSEFPTKFELSQRPDKAKPTVLVRFSVHYRVHSRQILCIGGSQIPLGWSFLSIAKVELQAGQRIEHKYVILEEQDWAPIVNEDSQGVVGYRTGTTPGKPPDLQVIQKQMAIVAWQPGPNRILQVPTEVELMELQPGDVMQRTPSRPSAREGFPKDAPSLLPDAKLDPFEGTREVLTTDGEGRPFLDRHDVWGWAPTASTRATDDLQGFTNISDNQ